MNVQEIFFVRLCGNPVYRKIRDIPVYRYPDILRHNTYTKYSAAPEIIEYTNLNVLV